MQYLYIFIGGALGAFIRYLLSFLNTTNGFPSGTFIANIIGAFLMGLLGSLAIQYFRNSPLLKKGMTSGFLGALTTFSTFQFELVGILQQQAYVMFITYALLSYIIGIWVCYVGVKMGERLS
ncbi:fluoride efflux transporter CrcB [Staphylococcus cohnii]|uniref:fluoride efflux transporter CrcB n=1 Tax=Staphylococcus TaxID=1279 RepID=UPI000D1C2108|nr:fluoride efflux transporter CrcB [Staphylococcus cohnii]PTF35175.1 fluoride efflux transporter CrcB [Staphylococcus cohnii]RIL89643.1 fluoride efflux transporter CrcB [Staphylococcus cohnii]